jgi:hypothetical protein
MCELEDLQTLPVGLLGRLLPELLDETDGGWPCSALDDGLHMLGFDLLAVGEAGLQQCSAGDRTDGPPDAAGGLMDKGLAFLLNSGVFCPQALRRPSI